jgi:D-amino-acid dehydrogenase
VLAVGSRQPFYIRPRFDPALVSWIVHFARAANRDHAKRSGRVLRYMLLASRELYEQLADRCDNAFGLTKRGLLMLCRTRAGLEEETRGAREARELDLPVEILTPARAADIDPGIGMDIAGAVFYPLDCHLDPRLLMRKLTELAIAAGITIHWSTRLDGWRTDGTRVAAAVTSQGELAADEFVLAAGAWSSEAAHPLGCKLLLQGGKGYSFTVPNPPQLDGLPYIGRFARYSNLCVAAGHASWASALRRSPGSSLRRC